MSGHFIRLDIRGDHEHVVKLLDELRFDARRCQNQQDGAAV